MVSEIYRTIDPLPWAPLHASVQSSGRKRVVASRKKVHPYKRFELKKSRRRDRRAAVADVNEVIPSIKETAREKEDRWFSLIVRFLRPQIWIINILLLLLYCYKYNFGSPSLGLRFDVDAHSVGVPAVVLDIIMDTGEYIWEIPLKSKVQFIPTGLKIPLTKWFGPRTMRPNFPVGQKMYLKILKSQVFITITFITS